MKPKKSKFDVAKIPKLTSLATAVFWGIIDGTLFQPKHPLAIILVSFFSLISVIINDYLVFRQIEEFEQ